MPRERRIEYAGAVYHGKARGDRRGDIVHARTESVRLGGSQEERLAQGTGGGPRSRAGAHRQRMAGRTASHWRPQRGQKNHWAGPRAGEGGPHGQADRQENQGNGQSVMTDPYFLSRSSRELAICNLQRESFSFGPAPQPPRGGGQKDKEARVVFVRRRVAFDPESAGDRAGFDGVPRRRRRVRVPRRPSLCFPACRVL